MNTIQKVIDIRPAQSIIGDCHLILESTGSGVSCLWYKSEGRSIEGVVVFSYPSGFSESADVSALNDLLKTESILPFPKNKVSFFYNLSDSVLIPSQFVSATSGTFSLSLLFGEAADMRHYQEEISDAAITHCYRISDKIDTFWNQNISDFQPKHSLNSLLRKMNCPNNEDAFFCIFMPQTVQVIFFKKGALQMIKHIVFDTPRNAAYHLLNICEQYEVKASDIPLLVQGMIDTDSNLYRELFLYFDNINFLQPDTDSLLAPALSSYPGHYFNHLFLLAACVS